ncbi:MAG: hypothetical protein K2M87_06890 [Muribaculaceae bacterium]|nr:hypothetical protein [Muribaculaceae bacterium]
MRKTIIALGLIAGLQAFGSPSASLKTERVQIDDFVVDLAPGCRACVIHIDEKGQTSEQIIDVPESAEMRRARERFVETADTKHTLSVKCQVDADGKYPSDVYVLNGPYIYWRMDGAESCDFNLPEGKYDIQVVYNDYLKSTVFFNGIELNEDKSVRVNANMADKIIGFKPLMPDGSTMVLPVDENPDMPYNTKSFLCDCSPMINESSQWVKIIVASIGGDTPWITTAMKSNFGEGTQTFWELVTSTTDYGYLSMCKVFDTSDAMNGEIYSNNPDYYTMVTPEFEHTPLYADLGMANPGRGMMSNLYRNDNSVFVGCGLTVYDVNKMTHYACNEPADFSTFYTMINIKDVDEYNQQGPKWGVEAPYLALNQEGIATYYCRHEDMTVFDHTGDGTKGGAPINFHFSYPFNPEYAMGSTWATAVVGAKPVTSGSTTFYDFATSAYYGNYMDNRKIDLMNNSYSATLNGEKVKFTSSITLSRWLSARAMDPTVTPGKVEITFTDKNIKVDDIKGKNTCTISYMEGTDDVIPPTLQRLMLRNTDGLPTIKFANPVEGRITLCGGDFHPSIVDFKRGEYTEQLIAYTYKPASVLVECAPKGSTEFTAIPMQIDESKYLPTFGDFWEGSLTGIENAAKGWYDMRITLTDEAGNTQTQLVSPAFYLESGDSGVKTAMAADNTLSVADGKIVSASGEEVSVYNMHGYRVANVSLEPGIYVAVTKSAKSKITVK